MVRKVIQAVYKEVRGLHRAAYVLAIFTLGSQLLALIRDRLLAHQFGAGIDLDLYYAAFRIPDLLYVLFASTLSVYVLIPFITERLESTNVGRAKELMSQIFTLFLVVYVAMATVMGIFAPLFVSIIFPGFEAYETELVTLIRILLLQPFFLGLSSLFGVVTQIHHRFILYAVSPLIYNAGIIFGLIVLYPSLGLPGLVFGVVIGAVCHAGVQLPFIVASGLAPRLTVITAWSEIREVLVISLPRALTLSLHQLVLLGLIGFASIMSVGSVAVFQFAFNLQSVPLAIIGISYSVAAFPMLAKLYAEGKFDEFALHIQTALRHIIFWSFPILALIVVIRAQFVRVVLGTGAFDWDDTRLTAAVLALFAISLIAQAANLLLIRALYAAGNTRIPFYTTLGSSFAILIFSFGLYVLYLNEPQFQLALEIMMRVQDVPGTEVLVLALGYTIALILHSVTLAVLSARILSYPLLNISGNLFRAFVAALSAGFVAYTTLNFFVEGLRTETLIGIFLQGLLAGVLGLIAATLAYYAQGSRELSEVAHALRRRLFKAEVVAPQDEDHLAV